MKNIIGFFIKNALFADLISIFLIFIGIFATTQIRRDAFPNINFDTITITTFYAGASAEEMEKLIMSLSLENDDEYRRTKVSTLFAEELAKPNGYPHRFTELFDSVLMITGERVQNEARINAAQESGPQQPVAIELDVDITEVVYVPREKSAAELQLWAFIDMMVQTKTLVKKAMGELGSSGSFT